MQEKTHMEKTLVMKIAMLCKRGLLIYYIFVWFKIARENPEEIIICRITMIGIA